MKATSTPSRTGLWFSLPYIVLFGLFLGFPIVYGMWMSFTNRSLTGAGNSFVGLENYLEALSDPLLWKTLGNTVFFTLITTVPLVLLALVMALLVAAGLPGQWLWRLSFFAPYLLPVAVVYMMWQWTLQTDFGLVNGLLTTLGLEQVPFFSAEGVAMYSVALVTVWWTVGFNFLLYLSALQDIPDHLYEAAAIDGAGPWKRLFSITLPLLGKATGLIVVLQVLSSLKVFDQIYLLTQGGPDNSTRSLLMYVYDTGFTNYRLGYASALSYIFFTLIVLVALAQAWLTSSRKAQA